jgi:hypothetical protein
LSFQTKDLGCTLSDYTISRAGRLVREPGQGMFRPAHSRPVVAPLHGDLRMYAGLETKTGKHRWVEYRVRFTSGRVEWIRPEPRQRSRARRQAPAIPGDERGPLIPGIEARSVTPKEFASHTPGKLELLNGRVVGDERLLMLILTSLGLRHAIPTPGTRKLAGGIVVVRRPPLKQARRGIRLARRADLVWHAHG